jgi:uroporphyrinogen-III synthase
MSEQSKSLRVLLTQREGRLEGLTAALTMHGFEVTHHPLIETAFLQGDALASSARALLACDWLFFTSRTAVQAWAALGLPLTGEVPKIGVVGGVTAQEVTRLGGHVALVAEPANAQGLLNTFRACVAPPACVGLPCGEGALPTLADSLGKAGFSVTKVPLYRTMTRPFPEVEADLIVLASPSAVTALPETLADRTKLVALGPSTARAVKERGWNASEAATPDLEGVVRAVLHVLKCTERGTPRDLLTLEPL